ncbi:MAG: 50S ribosomal protein L25 [Anaerolineales bacterium]|nr:50S ribosomal protein L25 [Anaerolineales bacterium]
MEEKVLLGEPRTVVGKQVRALRRIGIIPAVIYGHGIDPLTISLNYKEANTILSGISSSQLLVVEIEGKKHITLVRQKQRDPVTSILLHVDFQEVSMTELLRATVGIELVGESPAAKNYGAIIVTGLEKLEIECLPGDLPERIVLDIAVLKEIGDAVYVRDLPIPSKVEVFDDGDELVVIATAPISEAELAEGEPVMVEPEVIERGKKEEEEF